MFICGRVIHRGKNEAGDNWTEVEPFGGQFVRMDEVPPVHAWQTKYGLTVASFADDEVKVDFWSEIPRRVK